MVAETVPASQASDGRWRTTYVPLAANALSVAVLNGASAKGLTYSFTPDGFTYGISQDTVDDKRLTLKQNLSRPGRKTESLETKYVRSTAAGSAFAVLKEGVEGKLVIRRGVDNATDYAVGDVVDVITFQAGSQRPDAPTENGLDTVSQTFFITAVTQQDVLLVA